MNNRDRLVENVVNEILDFEVPVVVLGLRPDNMLEIIGKYNSYVEYKAKFRVNDIRYNKIVVVYGEVNDIKNIEAESI